ncbi:MAG TPA: type II secretion system protein [bacterium]|nr:type II secretion system protein [bacterium]
MNRKGFTLIELILVIAILGILAVSALPKFFDVSENAAEAARDGVIGAVRSGIALYRANSMITTGGTGSYPADLGAGFANILENPVTAADGWVSNTATNYVYNKGGVNNTLVYNSAAGTFGY